MLIRTLKGERVYTRAAAAEFGSTDPTMMRLMKGRSTAGITVDNDKTFGIPSVIESIRLAAQAVGMLGWSVFDYAKPTLPIAATDAWQADLIERPQMTNKFNMFQDLSASVDGLGNAFLQKIKAGGKVVALKVIDADRVRIHIDRATGGTLFDISNGPGVKALKNLTTDDILHIRGFAVSGLVSGKSLVQAFSQSIGNQLAIEEFSGRWWSQSGMTSQVITHPEVLNNSQADEILSIFEETHTGLENAGKPALLTGGAKLETVNITAEDAQLISSRNWSVEEIARMCNIPIELLTGGRSEMAKTEEVLMRFNTLYVLPRVERIRAAFNDDPDLFAGTPLWLDAKWDKLRAVDAQSQSMFDLAHRQGGILTANEIRAKLGYPPHADGDQLQITPVGGGANPSSETAPKKAA